MKNAPPSGSPSWTEAYNGQPDFAKKFAGLKKTRTRPAPAAILATWQGQKRPIVVDVDIVAAGTAETYSYLCALTKGSAYVRRVMS